MAMEAFLGSWNSKDHVFRVDFFQQAQKVKAYVFENNAQRFEVMEDQITVERYNFNDLLQGHNQITAHMSQLDLDQKYYITQTLSSRHIEIINDAPFSGHINITAPSG